MKSNVLKKLIACTCTVAMAATLTVGCGSDDTSKDTSTDASTEGTGEGEFEGRTISVLMQQSRYYDGFVAMVDKLEEEEGITLDIQIVPDENMESVIQMQINSGEVPDLIDYNIPHLYGILDPVEYLADLSGEAWVDNLVTSDFITYKDGNIYGFPLQSSSGISGIVYNKDVFEENNITAPTTTEEFNAVCDQLLEAGITPVMLPSDNWVPQIWMSAGYALSVGSEEDCIALADAVFSNQAKFTDYPELAEVVDTYLGMFENGYVNEDYLTLSYDSMIETIADGEGAMMMGTSGILATMEGLFEDANLGIFNVPFDFNRNDMLVSQQFTIGFGVTKESQNLDVVKYVLDLWSTPEYLDLWFGDQAGFPAFNGVNGGDINEDVTTLYDAHAETGNIVGEMNNYWTSVEPVFASSLWVYYLDAPAKGIGSEELLTNFQTEVTKYLTEMQYEGF